MYLNVLKIFATWNIKLMFLLLLCGITPELMQNKINFYSNTLDSGTY